MPISSPAKAAAIAILIAAAAPSLAEEAPVPAPSLPADTVRLSPDQREAALEAAATRSDNDLPINGLSRGIHGEMGMEVGSNGSHALYGTTTVPLGQTGSASFSFLTANSGHYRYR